VRDGGLDRAERNPTTQQLDSRRESDFADPGAKAQQNAFRPFDRRDDLGIDAVAVVGAIHADGNAADAPGVAK
jgi:hypothetical protein